MLMSAGKTDPDTVWVNVTGSNTPENSNNQCVSYWSLNVTLEVHMRLVKNQPGSFSILLSYAI